MAVSDGDLEKFLPTEKLGIPPHTRTNPSSKQPTRRSYLSSLLLAILGIFVILCLIRDPKPPPLPQLPPLPQRQRLPDPPRLPQLPQLPRQPQLPLLPYLPQVPNLLRPSPPSHEPSLTHPTHLLHLPSHFLPTHSNNRRLILIGDVHGCLDSLHAVLHAANFKPAHDHLILTGDTIDKGPNSHGVIAFSRSVSASCVRGNHEDAVLKFIHQQRVRAGDDAGLASLAASVSEDVVTAADTALELSGKDVEWLAACPLLLSLGDLSAYPRAEEAVVVHAGVVPGLPLGRQDPFALMHMRALKKKKKGVYVPQESRREGRPWFEVWGEEMDRFSGRAVEGQLEGVEQEGDGNIEAEEIEDIAEREAEDEDEEEEEDGFDGQASRHIKGILVIYGHDSKVGLNIRKWSKGLDSGCVNGDRLSALVIDAEGSEIVSVGCLEEREELR